MALLILKVTVLLAAALAGDLLLRRAPAALRHALWTAVFAGVLLLPLLSRALPPIGIPTEIRGTYLFSTDSPDLGTVVPPDFDGHMPEAAVAPALTAVSPSQTADRTGPERTARPTDAAASPAWNWPSPEQVLFSVWLVGLIAALSAIVISLIRVRQLTRTAKDVVDSEWRTMAEEAAARFGRRPVRLLMTARIDVPMAGGLWRPTIFLPAAAATWPIDRRTVVLAHELTHLAARDPLRHLVARLALAVYWFHPLAWLAARQANAACEQACDEAVVAGGILPSTYARVLLALADATSRPRRALAALPIVRPPLERRLMAVLDGRVRRTRLTAALITCLVPTMGAVLLAAAAPVTLGPLEVTLPPEPGPSPMALVPSRSALEIAELATSPAQTRLANDVRAGSIAGQVVDALTGAPVVGASVILRAMDDPSWPPAGLIVSTDDGGRYGFEELSAGRFLVSSRADGYLFGSPGRRSPSDPSTGPVRLGPAERRTDLEIRLWPTPGIRGRVTDERGEPLVNVSVTFLRRTYQDGTMVWLPSGSARTDDRVSTSAEGGCSPGSISSCCRLINLISGLIVRDTKRSITGEGGAPPTPRS